MKFAKFFISKNIFFLKIAFYTQKQSQIQTKTASRRSKHCQRVVKCINRHKLVSANRLYASTLLGTDTELSHRRNTHAYMHTQTSSSELSGVAIHLLITRQRIKRIVFEFDCGNCGAAYRERKCLSLAAKYTRWQITHEDLPSYVCVCMYVCLPMCLSLQ